MVYKNVSFGLSDYTPKTIWNEDELDYNSEEDEYQEPLDPESWQDWHSEVLLDDYMEIRDYYESQYLKAPLTFHDYCQLKLSQSSSHVAGHS
jgi:hypothetical protein